MGLVEAAVLSRNARCAAIVLSSAREDTHLYTTLAPIPLAYRPLTEKVAAILPRSPPSPPL